MLEKLINKDGEEFPIISKGESLSIISAIRDSINSQTVLELIIDDNDVLNLLTNHKTTMTSFRGHNFPLLFSLSENAKPALEGQFDDLSKQRSILTQRLIGKILSESLPHIIKNMDLSGSEVSSLNRLTRSGGFKDFNSIISDLSPEMREKIITGLFKGSIENIIPAGLSFLDSLKASVIDFGIKPRDNLINASDLTENEYEQIIEKLELSHKIINPLLSLYWCNSKSHPHFSFYTVGQKLSNAKCPVCGEILYYGIFYYFEPNIFKLLRAKEGLIKCLTLYIADNSGLRWLPDVYLKDHPDDEEKDVIIETESNKYVIIEVKNHAKDVRMRTKEEHLLQLFHQAKRHLEGYKKHDIEVDDVFVIFNHVYDDELKKYAQDLLNRDVFATLKNHLKVIGITDLETIKELK